MKKYAIFVLTLALVLAAVVPAAADQPVKSYDVPVAGDYQPIVDCRPEGYDFEIWDHWTGTANATEFYDKDGNLTRVYLKYKATDNFYRPDDSERVLTGDASGVQQLEPVSSDPPLWISKWLGPTFDIQLHGEPKLVHVMGTITVLIDDENNWLEVYRVTAHPRWDIPGLCAYFAE